MISRSRRNLFSFGENDNAGTKAFNSHADGALHAKEEEGRGGCSAPGMVQCRGTRRRGTVVGVCLVPEGGVRVVSGETRMECSLRTRIRG